MRRPSLIMNDICALALDRLKALELQDPVLQGVALRGDDTKKLVAQVNDRISEHYLEKIIWIILNSEYPLARLLDPTAGDNPR